MELANLINDLLYAANELSRFNSMPEHARPDGYTRFQHDAENDVKVAERALKAAFCVIVADGLTIRTP